MRDHFSQRVSAASPDQFLSYRTRAVLEPTQAGVFIPTLLELIRGNRRRSRIRLPYDVLIRLKNKSILTLPELLDVPHTAGLQYRAIQDQKSSSSSTCVHHGGSDLRNESVENDGDVHSDRCPIFSSRCAEGTHLSVNRSHIHLITCFCFPFLVSFGRKS